MEHFEKFGMTRTFLSKNDWPVAILSSDILSQFSLLYSYCLYNKFTF